MAVRRDLESRLRRILATFRYGEVQTPAFEELELFLAKSGPGIKDEIYAFQDKSGRDLCLRPELTAPAMRFYFQSLKMEPKPLRLFYFGPCYRYDKPQAGRYREFWQLGTEVVGDASPEAHAELLWLAVRLVQEAGVNEWVLRVGHLEILRSVLRDVLKVPLADQGELMRSIDKKDLTPLKEKLLARAPPEAVEGFLALFEGASLEDVRAAFGSGPTPTAAMDHVARVLELLIGFGAPAAKVQFDPTIARGLDYYGGLVFEMDCPRLGAQKQVLGGGEYDLSSVFGAERVATVGFGLGFDRVLEALKVIGTPPPPGARVDALVAALAPAGVPLAQRTATALRDAGAIVELDLAGKGPRKPLERASKLQARHAVLVGEREAQTQTLAVKDLASGAQSDLTFEDAVKKLLHA